MGENYPNLPEYFDYYDNALKVVETSEGRVRGYLLDVDTGKFRVANSVLSNVLFAHGEDITSMSEDDFIELTEESRSYHLRGEGPIFAIYRQIADLFAQKDSFDKDEWRSKRDLVSELRRRTFAMWEEEFARQEAGEPPSFKYGSVAGPAVENSKHIDNAPDRKFWY